MEQVIEKEHLNLRPVCNGGTEKEVHDMAPEFRRLISTLPLAGLVKMKVDFEAEASEDSEVLKAMIADMDMELHRRKTKERREMKLNDIKILPCYAEHPPKEKKMKRKRTYYADTGLLQSEIILDSGNNLIDGFTSYLVAQENGIDTVPVQYGERQIIKGYHKTGGELYAWELPGLLVGHVAAGDKVLVHTRRGVRTVTVAVVEPYSPEKYPGPLLSVIRKRHKGVA